MKHSVLDEPRPHAALGQAVRRTLFQPLLASGIAVLLAAIAGGFAAAAFGGAEEQNSLLAAAIGAGAAGIGAALAISLKLSRAIAEIAVRPGEMLLDQVEGEGNIFHWTRGRRLGREAIEADLKLLQRLVRKSRFRSFATTRELEQVRERTHQESLAKSQFIAAMSHELRTPLNAILGYAMLLQEDANEVGNASTVADLERIQQAGRTLLALINNILELSKIEAGRIAVERAVIDPAALARSVATDCGAYDRAKGADFEIEVGEGVGIMIGDAAKLQQCIGNLLRTAIRLCPEGSIRLVVESIERDGKECVGFSVSHDGSEIGGCSAEAKAEDTPNLELTIARRLAALMGGDCSVESKRGKGSIFRLVAPLGEPLQLSDLAPNRAEPRNHFIESPRGQHTILIVEDDAASLELLQRWLARMGCSVLSTQSGESALMLARSHRPDLILLDALLPERSGYEVLEEICADPEIGQIPTILITVDDDRPRGLKAGAADYLRKPVTEEQLRAALDLYLRPACGDILVIEDDDASAELLERSVAQAGFSARRASNGAEGLAMATESTPHAIVLDLAMPTMNGFELLDRLAGDDRLKNVPLIVVSGCDITIDDHRRLAAAGHRFFVKAGFTPREIVQSLRELTA